MARTNNARGPRGQVEKVNLLLVKKNPMKENYTTTQRATIRAATIVKSKRNSVANTVPRPSARNFKCSGIGQGALSRQEREREEEEE